MSYLRSTTVLFGLLVVIQIASAQIISDERACGILYSEENSGGLQFTLGDEDYSVNLVQDLRVSDNGWNVTRSISVENGCKVKVCNSTHLDGSCTTLRHGSHSANQNSIIYDIASVQCSCDKQCRCSDVHVKKSKCGRAYIDGGCQICNTIYTDLILNKTLSRKFPMDFEKRIKAIRLRRGCELRIYSEEDQEGDEIVITEETTENFDGEIRSYECECNDALYLPKKRPPRPNTYPQLVDIPGSMDDVIKMMRHEDYKNHPGLKAARRSYRNKRSSKNAYILLLGSTGAGKSSTINLLFDNPNITKVGDYESTTTNIHEFRIPVPIDELGIENSELRVIDTPGLGDTRGLKQDAKFLATLDNYLSTHEELKDRIPNIVLVLHPFNDKRFNGEGSRFVKMIRGLDTFSKRIFDENYSNVIFVLSHLCSIDKAEQRNPEKRIKKFQEVIQDYSLYPKPTHIVVTENKPAQEYLPVVNGYTKLPNFEYYPRNLFEKMELVTQRGGDPIGLGVFRTAFRDSENFNITPSTFQLEESNTDLVQKYLGVLMNADYGVVKTEVSQQLKETWKYIDPELRVKFPFALPYLQKALNLRNINVMTDVPRTTTEILNLLTVLKLNDATKQLLEKGLNIKSPEFPLNTVAGYSYDVFKDMPLPASPFKLGDFQYSDIGFMIPKSLTCKLTPDTKENFLMFRTKQDYLQYRLHSLGIEGSIPVEKFTDEIKPGWNIEEYSLKNDSCSVSATKDFRIFEFILNDRLDLTPEFVETVRGLPSFNESDHVNVGKWQSFFNTYGTHVVKKIYGGGSIQVRLESDRPINDEFKQTMFDLIKFAEDLTFDMVGGEQDNSNRTVLTSSTGSSQSMKFIGGNPDFHSGDLTKMSVTEANKLLINWKKSLKFSPAILTTEMRLVPISQIVKKLRQNYTQEIERATRLHFNSSLIYTPPPTKRNQGPAPDRDNTPRMRELELELKLKEQENIANQLNLEKFKIQQDNFLKNLTIQSEMKKAEMNRDQTAIRLKHEAAEKEKQRKHEEHLENLKREGELQQKKLEADIALKQQEFEKEQEKLAKQQQLELEKFRIQQENELKNQTLLSNERKAELERNATAIRLQHEAAEKEKQRLHEQKLEEIRKAAEVKQKEIEAAIAKEKQAHEKALLDRKLAEEAKQKELDHQRKLALIAATSTTIRPPPPPPPPIIHTDSCLKQGTKILMADMTEKPVEMVKVGDMLLDKDLLPTRVLGTAHKYLLDQKFYGFEDNKFFFTNNHVFVGPTDDDKSDMKLYALSPYQLNSNNPLMAYLNVTEMMDSEKTSLYSLQNTPGNPTLTTATIHKFYLDPENYPTDTLMYDLQVDSPTGTYFANGYVCRHEIPPVEFWPNTMSIMFRLMSSKNFDRLEALSYTVENALKLRGMTEKIAARVENHISKMFANKYDKMRVRLGEETQFPRMTLEDTNVEECISRMFKYPSLSTAAISLYAKSGAIIARFMDGDMESLLSDHEMGKVQNDLMEFLSMELENGLRDFNV